MNTTAGHDPNSGRPVPIGAPPAATTPHVAPYYRQSRYLVHASGKEGVVALYADCDTGTYVGLVYLNTVR